MQGGLLRSQDGGETWEDLTGRGLNDDCHRLVIRPSAPEQMFISHGVRALSNVREDISDRIRGIGYPDLMVYHPYDDRLMFLAGAGSIPLCGLSAGRLPLALLEVETVGRVGSSSGARLRMPWRRTSRP
mgnify:CR=1 FL=1